MSIVHSVSPEQAKQLKKDGAIFIDVREPAEFNNRHIHDAKLHPLGKVDAKSIEQHKAQTIVIYCQKGVRSEKACTKILRENPSAKIVNLSGGIESWQQAGLETNKGESDVLSLDRQVQVTIGAMVLLFSLLALFANSNFAWGAIFVGTGLVFAGLSGFCGLSRLLALAPWNR